MYPQGFREMCKRIQAQVVLKGCCLRRLSVVVRGPQRHTVRAGTDGAGVKGAWPGEELFRLGAGVTSWFPRGFPTCP